MFGLEPVFNCLSAAKYTTELADMVPLLGRKGCRRIRSRKRDGDRYRQCNIRVDFNSLMVQDPNAGSCQRHRRQTCDGQSGSISSTAKKQQQALTSVRILGAVLAILYLCHCRRVVID